MKYRVTRIQELPNPAFQAELNGSTAAERREQAQQPECIYEVELAVDGSHCGGNMTLSYNYAPLLAIGAVYTMEELEQV